jgi:Got1/Sft2-like family
MRNPFANMERGETPFFQDSGCFNLNKTQRLWGFGICFGVGMILSLFGTILLFSSNVIGFVITYTLGNLISFCGTGFLVGILKQLKTMFSPDRWITTTLLFLFMSLTLIFGLAFEQKLVVFSLIFCILQAMALFWYSLSYIPLARAAVIKMMPWN